MSAADHAASDNNDVQEVAESSTSARNRVNRDTDPPQGHDEASALEDDDSEEEEEPKLKYDKLTSRIANLYRNGDSCSAVLLAGSKIILGTHNGNIHILDLASFQPLRTYQAHSATITSCSVSPLPPPPTLVQKADGGVVSLSSAIRTATATPATNPKAPKAPIAIPNTPDNAIHIATSSLDGHVCIFSLHDPKDIQLRNFARPVNAVALSPEYKSDRTYVSGGRAGNLVLTSASSWLGSVGMRANKDTILHQGEGIISTIKWSLSGKWVMWVNEEGIKIMRSHIKLGSEEGDHAWRRISHAAKPNRRIWEEMAGVWRARAHWINESALEEDTDDVVLPTNGDSKNKSPSKKKKRAFEKLIVGWGDTAWILNVEGIPVTETGQVGKADIVHKLQFRDCVVSGLCLYSPSLLAILAYRTRDESAKEAAVPEKSDAPRKGRSHRHTGLAPQLRLINVNDGEELDVDELPMQRFETLSAQDYDFESVWIPPVITEKSARESKGAIEGLWELSGGQYAQRLLSSGASVLSRTSSEDGRRRNSLVPANGTERTANEHQFLMEPGLKLFISSPYDCVLAVRRQAADHLDWLLQHEKYAQAWEILNETPEIVDSRSPDHLSIASGRTGQQQQSLADFLHSSESASVRSSEQANVASTSAEKLRVGDLWLNQLVTAERWSEAGEVANKVLTGSSRWQHWIIRFAEAGHYDEITLAVPKVPVHPYIPSSAYSLLLEHYVTASPPRLRQLVDDWDEGLIDASTVVSAIRARLSGDEVKQDSSDWRALLEAQGQLYLSLANPQEALRCFIKTKNADRAFALIQDEKIADALNDVVTGFVTIRIDATSMKTSSLAELDEASEQAVRILVEEAHKGTLLPATVIDQLRRQGSAFRPFLYFYLRTLWRGLDAERAPTISRRVFNKTIDEGHAMVEDFADLAIEIFAEYDRSLLMEFLEASEVYDYNRAATICDERKYVPELVLVLSRTGQTKRALWLIIGELNDATRAIAFVKQNPDLWDDLLEYGMDKPKFVRGLLAEVGTSIDPVKIVQRIPAGLEIEGLKQGILNLVQGWEVQLEVSRGVERVLRGEVLAGMDTLRQGQRRGIRFEVIHEGGDRVDLSVDPAGGEKSPQARAGHCAGCDEIFHEEETQPLLGFACGHVYHLSCLLSTQHADAKTYRNIMNSLGYEDNDDDSTSYTTRSVGAKVAHAHVIRTAVDSCCGICGTA